MDFAQIKDTLGIVGGRLIRGDIKGLRRLGQVNTLFDESKICWNFTHMDQLFESYEFAPSAAVSAFPDAGEGIPESYVVNGAEVALADHIRDRSLTAFVVIKDGVLRKEQYFQGTGAADRRVSWSMSKSVTSLLLGALIDKGIIAADALGGIVSDVVPSLRGTGYDGVTLEQVLTMSSGVRFNEDYLDYHSDINRFGRVAGVGGSFDEFASTLGREWEPGRYMHYVSIDTHVIGMVIRALTGRDMVALMQEHIIGPMGFEHRAYFITDETGEPMVLGGLNLSTRDYARVAMMVMGGGFWNGQQVVSKAWIEKTTRPCAPEPDPETAATPDGKLLYGMQWWMPPEPQEGEVFGVGIYGQYIYMNGRNGVVIAQNATDRGFRVGDGVVNQATLALFRAMAEAV